MTHDKHNDDDPLRALRMLRELLQGHIPAVDLDLDIEGGERIVPQGEATDDRVDIFICFACTLDTPDTLGRPAAIYHTWDMIEEIPEQKVSECTPYWRRDVTLGHQRALFDYEIALHRMKTEYGNIDVFNSRRNNERIGGIRELANDSVPHPHSGSTSFESIAKHTDRTGHGMFPEEVMAFVAELRTKTLEFPTSYQDIPLFEVSGESLGQAMCEGELLHFATWLNTKEAGAGSRFVAGPIRQEYVDRGITEEIVENAWNKAEGMSTLLKALFGGPRDE